VERFHRMLVERIKTEVMTEMERNRRYPESYRGGGYQAYCQLVDAVREEVLYDLKNRPEWNYRPYHSGSYGYLGRSGQTMTPEEIRMIKDEVVRDLQMNQEGQEERMTKH
jgi:hypothetical protein